MAERVDVRLWDMLGVDMDHQSRLDGKVKDIIATCQETHGVENVTRCDQCYKALVLAFRDRYLQSTEREWFSDRPLFHEDLRKLFRQAEEQKWPPKAIEKYIEAERKRWLRATVQDSVTINLLAQESMTKEEFQAKIQDPKVDIKDLCRTIIHKAASKDEVRDKEIGELTERLVQARAKGNEEILEVLKAIVFDRSVGPYDLKSGRLALQLVKDCLEKDEAFAILEALVANQPSDSKAQEKEKWMKRRDELLRAKAAHTKRKTEQQDTTPKARPTALSYPGTPCDACNGEVRKDTVYQCPLCFVLVGNRVLPEMTRYCSKECYESDRGQQSHQDNWHFCSADDRCILANEEKNDPHAIVFCAECLHSLKLSSVYCCAECAAADFQIHRERVHLPERAEQDVLVEDSETMEFEDNFQEKYHAKDIWKHIVSLHDETARLREFFSL